MAAPSQEIACAENGCDQSFQDHRWGRIKADGWFHQRDGLSWCSAHVPPWVEAWRAQKAAQQPETPAAPDTTITESETA